MKTKRIEVSLREINFRKTPFLLSFGRADDDLRKSIAAVGVINTPLLRRDPSDGRYVIVSGFRRLRVCKALGISPVECRELITPRSDKDLLRLALFENLGERSFNPIEVGMALVRLSGFLPAREIVKDFLPLFHLEPSYEQYEKYSSLVRLEMPIKNAIASYRTNVSIARDLLRVRPAERATLFALYQHLRLGVNLQKEFFDLLFDASRRDAQSIQEILELPRLRSVIQDERLPLAQKTERLRSHLHRMRYPRLSTREEEFHAFVGRCKLPPAVKMEPPPFFEGETFTLTARFRSADEFRAIAGAIYGAAEKNIPTSLFE
jgi:ParB family chromosome partitioning protein